MVYTYLRLEGVEARLQETSEAFEQSRAVAKKSKLEYERVKKMRCDVCFDQSLSGAYIIVVVIVV